MWYSLSDSKKKVVTSCVPFEITFEDALPFSTENIICRYLHEVCSPSIVHKNFKSSNILLDSEFNPHVSDAGLASFMPDAEFQVWSIYYNTTDEQKFAILQQLF